jgi:hypothetical protein
VVAMIGIAGLAVAAQGFMRPSGAALPEEA